MPATEPARQKAALTIQCFWRRIMAARKVVNARLWKWVTNRNTVKIQCAARRRFARDRRRDAEAQRALKREVLARNVEARKMTKLVELIHWRGARCHDAACAIQRWYREGRDVGFAASASDNFAKAVKKAQHRRDLVVADEDAIKLAGSLSERGQHQNTKSVRIAAAA
jgi:hypothetical protein